LCVLVAQRPAHAETKARVGFLTRVVELLEQRLLCLQDRVGAILLDEQALVERGNADARWIGAIGLSQNPLQLPRSKTASNARCAQKHARFFLGTGRLVAAAQQTADAILPLVLTD